MFISRKEQIRKATTEFEATVKAIGGNYVESVRNSDDYHEDELVCIAHEFGKDKYLRSQVRMKLNLKTGVFTIGFAAYVDNQQTLWSALKHANNTYLEFPFNKFSGEMIEPLRAVVEDYFKNGFKVFNEQLYSNGKKPELHFHRIGETIIG